MAISLEELRRQREQIQKHLDWLDAKIAAEADNVACPTREAEAQRRLLAGRPEQSANQTEPETESGNAPATDNFESARHLEDTTAFTKSKPEVQDKRARHDTEIGQVSPSAEQPESATEAPQFKAKTAEELARAKIGCVVFFVLATALFLFLLFGLPYLL